MTILIKHFKYIIATVLTILSFSSIQAESNPQIIINNATSLMMGELKTNQALLKEDSTIVPEIVERLLLPHFASKTIARKVLGKHARKATDEQKEQFAEAFRGYMIRFYSNAFAEYSNETVEYLRTPDYESKKRVYVRTKLNRSTGAAIPIDYRLQRSGDSWKIIDIKIEGISLVISNRTQFGSSIARDGLDTVIAKLQYKNDNQ